MNSGLRALGSLAIGAGLMYFFDPNRGKRRRAIVRDKTLSALHDAEESFGRATRDLSNRAQGLMVETRHRFQTEVITEESMMARLRSKLGHVVSHPRAINIEHEYGRVLLTGHVIASELKSLLSGISSVRGVNAIDNQLEVHETADIPQLQGIRHPHEPFDLLTDEWAPGPRLLGSLAGITLAIYGFQRRNALGLTLGSLGLSLIARSLVNGQLGELIDRWEDEREDYHYDYDDLEASEMMG